MNTGLKEAKIIIPEDNNDSNAVQVIPDTTNKDNSDDTLFDDQLNEDLYEIEEKESQADRELRKKIKQLNFGGEITQLTESLLKLENYKKLNIRDFSQVLEVLSELGHELEYGIKIVENSINELLSIIQDDTLSDQLRGTAAKALGASFRNNPVAISKVSSVNIIKPLLDTIEKTNNNNFIGRLVYAIGSVVSNGEGDRHYYEKHDSEFLLDQGGEVFRRAFVNGGADLKKKISTFVFDHAVKLAWPKSELINWSNTFQSTLAKNELDGESKFMVFETLTEIHQYTGEISSTLQEPNRIIKRSKEEMLPVRDDFLQWLSKEMEFYNVHKHIKDDEENIYRKLIIQARHSIYGNPLAERKEILEDL